uniref:Uncharacterized protein n=1 Tax=Lygus hesperus TaxID=30085 RepID=A0A0K8TGF6_LYGHE
MIKIPKTVTNDMYKGELPEDFEEVKETKCKKCEANEKHLGADMPKISMTKKEFKTLRRALYKKMVDEGLLKYLVEALKALCPNTTHDLTMLGRLLVNPKDGEIKDLGERCRVVNKIALRIREMYGNTGQTVPLQTRLDAIIQETLDMKRVRKEESRMSRKTPTQSLIIIRDHICNPNCHWCQLHCDSFAKLSSEQNKKCDCQCVTLQPAPVRDWSKC